MAMKELPEAVITELANVQSGPTLVDTIIAVAEGSKSFAELLNFSADEYYGTTMCQVALLSISDGNALIRSRARLADTCAKTAPDNKKTAWANAAAGLEWATQGGFVRRR